MLQQAFDGRPPICVEANTGTSIIFLESNDEKWGLPPQLVEDVGFVDKTAFYADPSLHADVSTDDWPFFYMPQRIYPVSYLIMVFQILALSLLIGVNFLVSVRRVLESSESVVIQGRWPDSTRGSSDVDERKPRAL